MSNETTIRTRTRPLIEAADTGIDAALNKGQRRFLLIVTAFVFVISLGAGITIGLSRGSVQAAYARQMLLPPPAFHSLLPVGGMQLTAMGEGTRIGGAKAETASFFSDNPIEPMINEQVQIWKKQGFWTTSLASFQHGVAFAINRSTKERYQTIAFYCPPTVRTRLCGGMRVFGLTSYVEGSADDANGDAAKVPQCPQFRLGGVYSTTDLGRPSVTSSGVCGAGIEQTRQFFLDTLPGAGWVQKSEMPATSAEGSSTILLFDREGEQLSLVLSGSADGMQTLSVGTVARSQEEEM